MRCGITPILRAKATFARFEPRRFATFMPQRLSFETPLFDHLVEAVERRMRHGETDGLSGCHVDDKLHLGRKLYRQIARLLAFQNLIHKVGAAAGNRGAARAIGRVLTKSRTCPPELREAITRGRWRSRRWRGTLRGDARGIIVPPIPPQEIARYASCRHHR